MCLEEPSWLLHLASPFFAGAAKGKGSTPRARAMQGQACFPPRLLRETFLLLLAALFMPLVSEKDGPFV